MSQPLPYFGHFLSADRKIDFQIIYLDYIPKKILNIDAICFSPFNMEYPFKFNLNLTKENDLVVEVATTIVNSIIKDLNFIEKNLKRLVMRDGKTYYLMALENI